LCYTDFWDAYGKVLPDEQHQATDKGEGQTCHIERWNNTRWNNTLRQRLARFVRQTLSFSKSVRMHKVCLALFIHDYNRAHKINNTE
jgi:IS1 family transposase